VPSGDSVPQISKRVKEINRKMVPNHVRPGSTRNESTEPRAENSYDFVRFCAASAVLFSHHFALSRIPEPPVPGYGEDFGKLAVEVFFCLSGFLICRSLQKSTNWAQFVSARMLRILPNLTFSLTATSLGTLLWYSNYSHIWKHAKFVIGNLLMFFRGVTYTIPGVFEDAKGGPAVNGPLWSLPIEIWLYVLLFLFSVLGGRRSGFLIIIGALSLSLVWHATSPIGDFTLGPVGAYQFARLGSFFLSGAVLAACWPYIENHAVAIGATALLAIIFIGKVLLGATIFHSLALAAIVIGLGSSRAMAWFSKGGDASYGIYIFAWPLQQFSLLLINSFWLSMLLAFLTTTALGYATWHTFERRAMSSRKQFAERLQKCVERLARPRVES
jgi:peptidoglycan/LPS O-acetylase OafA/YrhL